MRVDSRVIVRSLRDLQPRRAAWNVGDDCIDESEASKELYASRQVVASSKARDSWNLR